MDGTLTKISFLKLQGRGGSPDPNTPQGWMGVNSMDLNHKITEKDQTNF